MIRRVAPLALCLAVVAAPTVAAPSIDACALLTKADIGDRLGKPLTSIASVQNGFSGDAAGCDYLAGPIRFVKLRIVEGSFAQHVKGDADFYHETVKPLHGLGDEAAFVGPFLWLRKHDAVLSLVVSSGKASGTKKDLALTERFARQIVSRLP